MQDLESTTTFVANCSINPQVYAKINLINKPTIRIELLLENYRFDCYRN